MGIRSAFNPLGALPIATTLSWTISHINMYDGSLILPSSWLIGGVAVGASSCTVVSSAVETGGETYTVTLSANYPSNGIGRTVTPNDSNFQTVE